MAHGESEYVEALTMLVLHCGFKHDWDCDCARTYRYLIRIAKPGRRRRRT